MNKLNKVIEAVKQSAMDAGLFSMGSQDGVESKHWLCYHQHLFSEFTIEELDKAYEVLKTEQDERT